MEESQPTPVPSRQTNFLQLVEYLNTAIQNINDGDIQGAISDINLVLARLIYNAKYIPCIEVPEEMIINNNQPDDPIMDEITKLLVDISGCERHVAEITLRKNNVDTDMEMSLKLIEEATEYISMSVDERKQKLQREIDEMNQDRDAKRLEIKNILKKHPEYIKNIQTQLEEFSNTQENPE